MVAIKIDTNVSMVAQQLSGFADRLHDWSTPLKAFGRILVRSVSDNFEAEGRPKAWKPLAQSTLFTRLGAGRLVTRKGKEAKRTQKRLGNVKILQDRGFLKNSVRAAVSGNTLRVGPSGPAAIYAAIHQFGGQAGRGRKSKIPARPYLVIQDEDARELVDLVKGQIERDKPKG